MTCSKKTKLRILADKTLGIVYSKRMLASTAAAAIQLLSEDLGIEKDAADYFAGVLLSWSIGDAFDGTRNIWMSRRFWIATAAVAAGVLSHLGIAIPSESLGDVLAPIAGAIIASSVRPVKSRSEKVHTLSR